MEPCAAGYHASNADVLGRRKCALRLRVGSPLLSDMDAFAYRGSRDVLPINRRMDVVSASAYIRSRRELASGI